MPSERGHINRDALRAANGIGGRKRTPLGKLVQAAAFGEGLVRMRSADGTRRVHVEAADVQEKLDAGWEID